MEETNRIIETRGPRRVSPFFIPMMIGNMAAGMISIQFSARGPNASLATACAAGTHAVGDAFKIIQSGKADAMIAGLGWVGEDILIWTPDVIGSVCFLIASYLALIEVSHRFWSVQPRQVSWWIVVLNMLGDPVGASLAFERALVANPFIPGALANAGLLAVQREDYGPWDCVHVTVGELPHEENV